MKTVFAISKSLYNKIKGRKYKENIFIDPPIDADGQRYISKEVRDRNEDKEMEKWFENLVVIPYNPIPYTP